MLWRKLNDVSSVASRNSMPLVFCPILSLANRTFFSCKSELRFPSPVSVDYLTDSETQPRPFIVDDGSFAPVIFAPIIFAPGIYSSCTQHLPLCRVPWDIRPPPLQGPACSHPPIMCALCRLPHKATDPTCPTFLQILTKGSSKGKEVEVMLAE
jgi:hypothetical protein